MKGSDLNEDDYEVNDEIEIYEEEYDIEDTDDNKEDEE